MPNVNELLESSQFSSKCLSCVVVVRPATLIHSIEGACPAAHQISKIIALCTVSADCLQKKAKNENQKTEKRKKKIQKYLELCFGAYFHALRLAAIRQCVCVLSLHVYVCICVYLLVCASSLAYKMVR